MEIKIIAKNYKENISKIKFEIERVISLLRNKFNFVNHNANKIHVTFEVNKNLTFLIKLNFNLINIGKQIIVSEVNENIFTAINQCKLKLEKQLTKIKDQI